MATKTRLVSIGNSRGIRIPKALLEQAQLPEELELHVQPGRLVVVGAKRPRSGWSAAARKMRERNDDVLLDASHPTAFDEVEWAWK
ncbi:MAG: AbrB/MazE/SpoVT family DNA-binding domain-containing protein [Bryobacterales bacterium]